jgi:hypothetical protein
VTVVGGDRQTITGHFGDKILHPNPISISGDLAALDVLVLAKKSTDGNAALQALMANHQVTDQLTNADTNEPVMFPFPLMGADEDPNVTFAGYYVSRLPVAVPLPMGHGVDTVSLEDGPAIEEFFETLRFISPCLEEWAQAMLKTTDFWVDLSLSSEIAGVPAEFFEGFTEPNPIQGTIFTKSSTVSTSTPEGKAVVARIESAKSANIDSWIMQNPTTYQEVASRLGNRASTLQDQATTQIQAPVIATVVKTRADKNDEARMLKAKAVMQLLLAREGTNADGEAILIPGELDLSIDDLFLETARNACRNLNMLFRTNIEGKKESDPMHLLYFATHFPYVMITPIFTGAFMAGHWATEPVHVDATSLGQNLGVLSFAPTKTNTAEHKRQLDETNSILGEDLVSAASSHRTKASLTLFDGGTVQHYSQAMTTIANLHAVLAVCDNANQSTPAISSTCLKEAFTVFAQPDMKLWVDRFTRGNGGEHLPYALILDLHNSWIHLSRMITEPRWIRAVMQNDEIPASAIAFFKATHTSVINKWQKAVASDTLGPYASPPSTWVSPKAKEQAKKSNKGTVASTPAGGQNPPARLSSGPDRRQQQAGRATGSDQNLGLIIAPDNVRNGPQLSSGKRLCMAFARMGKSCNQGLNCTGSHLTLKHASIPDLQTIEQWISNTANVSWAAGRPYRLNRVPPVTAPPIPPTHPAATQVTPEAANSNAAPGAQG